MHSLVRILTIVLDGILLLLGARFFLRLLGADPGNAIVAIVYRASGALLAPVQGILPGIATTGTVEWGALLAMLLYGLVFGIILSLLSRLAAETETDVHTHAPSEHA